MADLVITEKANIVSLADKVRALDGSTAQLSLYEMKNKLDEERANVNSALDVLANKGVQVPEGSSSAALPELIEAVRGTIPEENEVNFYDYDGTLLYSYTLEESNALTELPAPPAHEGLVFDGWNWDLENVQALTYPMDIGACYQTDDGSTRFYVKIDENLSSLTLSINLNGSYEIDWGDGTEKETITLEQGSLDFIQPSTHTYANYGDYVIKVKLLSGEAEIRQNPFYYTGMDNNQYYIQKVIKKVEIGQIQMAANAFKDCFELSKVSMPNNCLLKNSCFYHTGLNFIIVPKSNIRVPESAFQKSYLLTKISLNNLEEIGNSCFYDTSLTNIKISDNVKIISDRSFVNTRLQNIVIPDSVNSIGRFSFEGTPIIEFIFPKNITKIPSTIFQSCDELKKITMLGEITEIDSYAFNKCSSLKFFIIPNTTTTIGMYCFNDCGLLNITIPDSVTSIGSSCFYNNRDLTNVILSNNITKIPQRCFYYCSSLTSIMIPNSVQIIESYAFYRCSGLQYIDFSSHTSIPTLSDKYVFDSTTCEFRVPSALLDEWKAATNWATYADRIVGV